MNGLRIFLATPAGPLRDKMKETLNRHGALVVGEASDGMAALRALHSLLPDVVIIELQLPGLDGLELAKLCQEEKLGAAVLLTPYTQLGHVQKTLETWLFEPLIRPVREEALLASVITAHTHYIREARLAREVVELKEALEKRKIVNQAKRKLIEKLRINEEEAHRILQRYAMNHRISTKEAALRILKGYDAS
ncbi:ANTAR domain-containing protein [Heliobacterium chlorum]|uniref:Stage 0 sporulation protein A homolog n=1 Tax=Heliobacterium chlorum TaxID=2698 RepID=A0ABR7T7L0_HELCL|nr:ANTAR domain-containing protein [Heliobacterium chlorum]MBC9785556.1 ANTAR domain-containing protein [Heliobacterium chlorum]